MKRLETTGNEPYNAGTLVDRLLSKLTPKSASGQDQEHALSVTEQIRLAQLAALADKPGEQED